MPFKMLVLLPALWLPLQCGASEALLRLATTTTTASSGLLDYLLPRFSEQTSIPVRTIVVGSGKALRLGRDGEVDVLLVHARTAEDAFIAAGHGINRRDIMYNDFVLVGPATDPAGIGDGSSASDVMQRLHAAAHPFVSRGDDSGTHLRELELWRQAGREPAGGWYREVGQGMGKTLQIANQMDAYTLVDRATWLAQRSRLEIKLLFESEPALRNPYGIIAVNPARHSGINHAAAGRLIDWLTSAPVQQLIAGYKIDGRQLFYPWPD